MEHKGDGGTITMGKMVNAPLSGAPAANHRTLGRYHFLPSMRQKPPELQVIGTLKAVFRHFFVQGAARQA